MKIYLASRLSRRDELIGYKRQIEDDGHVVTSRWLTDLYEPWVDIPPELVPPTERGVWAINDLLDIDACDHLFHFTGNAEVGYSTGGRHVEMGFALGLGKRVAVIGPRENIFCDLDHHGNQVIQRDSWDDFWPLIRVLARLMDV